MHYPNDYHEKVRNINEIKVLIQIYPDADCTTIEREKTHFCGNSDADCITPSCRLHYHK